MQLSVSQPKYSLDDRCICASCLPKFFCIESELPPISMNSRTRNECCAVFPKHMTSGTRTVSELLISFRASASASKKGRKERQFFLRKKVGYPSLSIRKHSFIQPPETGWTEVIEMDSPSLREIASVMMDKSSNGKLFWRFQLFFEIVEQIVTSFLKNIQHIFETRFTPIVRIRNFIYIRLNIITKGFDL